MAKLTAQQIRIMHLESQTLASLTRRLPHIDRIIKTSPQSEEDFLLVEACLCFLAAFIRCRQAEVAIEEEGQDNVQKDKEDKE